jgi:hypothetical protein
MDIAAFVQCNVHCTPLQLAAISAHRRYNSNLRAGMEMGFEGNPNFLSYVMIFSMSIALWIHIAIETSSKIIDIQKCCHS